MRQKEIIVSKYCGFCSGVKRCVSLVENKLKENKEKRKVYSTGELLHNFYEMKRLENLGLNVIYDIKNIKDIAEDSIVIIRTHGIEKQIYEYLDKKKNIEIFDGTCPIVKKLQKIVKEYSKKGFNVIIFGNSEHPEIRALITYIDKNVDFVIIDSEKKAKEVEISQPAILVSQTTKQQKKYKQIIEILKKKYKDIKIFDTICKETILREKNAQEIAKKVDLMLVIGSKNSSNTKKLIDIAKENNDRVFLIENEKDLSKLDISIYNKIGIVSGSSTPIWLVEKIAKNIDLLSV